MPGGSPLRPFRDPWLSIPLALHVLFALLLWFSGSAHGTWTFECGVGALAWDVGHGRNPAFAWSDYYDSWTSGYLLWGVLAAPLTWLPGPPILGLKLGALLTTTAAAVLAWRYVAAVADEQTAGLSAAALLLAPPTLWFYAVHAGDYHYSELVVELLLFWRVAVRVQQDRWTPAVALELGALCGLAVSTSFGAGIPAVLTALVVLYLRPQWILRPASLLVPVGAAIGLLPLITKALHRPFGVAASAGEFDVPYAGGGGLTMLPHKLVRLPLRLAEHAGFADAATALTPVDFAVSAGVLAVAGAALLALRRREHALTALPGLLVLGVLGAYLLLPTVMGPRHPLVSDFRDVRFLPPVLGMAAVGLPMALRRWPRAQRLALLVPAAAPLAWGAMVDWPHLSPSIDHPGRCYELPGMYAGKHLPLTADGPARADVCDGFDDPGACLEGRHWAPAVYALAEGRLDPDALAATCAAQPRADARVCTRHLGRALLLQVGRVANPGRAISSRCGTLDPALRPWCHEGAGFWFADHLGAWPERFAPMFAGESDALQRAALAGVGARASLGSPPLAARARTCDAYARVVDGGEAACREGAGLREGP